jgi:alkylation response protein AidB-like acyl-CoA dehydrogenase
MWDLVLSDEQAMIEESVSQFLERELPLARLRPNSPPLDAAAAHAAMARLGWFATGIPEGAGGMGLGAIEEMLIQRRCGRHLVSPTALASVIGAHVARAAGDERLLDALIAGERTAALAIGALETTLRSFTALAFDWTEADMLLVWNAEGAGLFDPDSFTGPREEEALDDSLTLHRGTLDRGRARHWISTEDEPLGVRANLLLTARLTGLADGACALATEYARQREQFGRPIGSFQAIKHRCADMALRAETSGYLTALAALKLEAGAADAATQVAVAKLKASDAARENGRAVIQIHGGLGFQSECDAHWFMKRANIYDHAGGDMYAQARSIFAAPSLAW